MTLPVFGERGISGIFGWENNELHRKCFLHDPQNQLVPFLQSLFGPSSSPRPKAFPEPFGTMYAYSMSFEPVDHKAVQGDTTSAGDFTSWNSFPTFAGGVVCDVCFRPAQYGQYSLVNDETWDFSGQVMSLIGNAYAQNPASLIWETTKDNTPPTPVTNLSAITQILPKIDFMQRKIYVTEIPFDQADFIGCVNNSPVSVGTQDGSGTLTQWPAETLLLVGLPVTRRWRFDGAAVFEVSIRFAVNNFKNDTESGYDYVGWNRLYRTSQGWWERPLVGINQGYVYPTQNLQAVVQAF